MRFIPSALLTIVSLVASAQAPEPYRDASLSAHERAADLLPRLTLDEKISLMMDVSPAIERLGIPEYNWWNEALHGVGRAGLATVFPQSIGMAATFDNDAVLAAFNAVSDEARAKYNGFRREGRHGRYQGLTFWTPNVNIFRDPRWGRGQETYGEDPYLASVMGEAVVNGLQGPADSKYIKTIAGAKHYAVHSGPEWNRHSFDARDIDPRDLWETYLPAFKTLVDAGVGQVMCAYNRFEGEPCCSSKKLLIDILRNEWGYDKIIVTDCWAMNDFHNKRAHATHQSGVDASADAVLSGTDLECGSDFANLREAIDRGLITEEAIDESVMRLLEARFSLGEMDDDASSPWASIPMSAVDSKANRALALDMARKSMTLLKNNGVLPLARNASVIVMGPNANDSVMQWGNYNGFPSHTVTVLEGVRDITGRDIPYLRGCDHVINNNFVSCFNLLSSDGKPGLTATYWNNKSRDGQSVAVERLTVPVNKSTGGATVFAPGVNLTDFSARYVGTFKPEESGRYTMQLRTDNGFRRLSVDGTTLVDNSTKGNRNTYTCTFNAEKGKSYDIELLYGAGDRTALLSFDIGMIKDYDTDAGDADVVIFVGGIAPSLEGEEMPVSVPGFRGGDRESIELPAMQRNLLKNLKAQGKKIVYVNCSGSAVALAPEDSICDAILQAWYPGQAGGTAVAEVLYGDYNPAGRLPVTFYRDDSQLPDFLDYSMDGRTYRYMKDKPLYAFGHGLSYTTFDYESASLDRKSAKCGDNVNLHIKLRNAGKRDGDEVVQVYIRKEGDFGGPVKTLRAFKRVTLPAGTSRDIAFTLTPDAFKTYDQKSGRMAVTPGKYEILYGGSSENLKSLPLTLK